MTRKTIKTLALAWPAVVTAGAVAAAGDSQPMIEARLLNGKVFEGEQIVVLLRVTAPPDRGIEVLDAAVARQHYVIQAQFTAADGTVSRYRPQNDETDWERFHTLPAKESVEFSCCTLWASGKAGSYIADVKPRVVQGIDLPVLRISLEVIELKADSVVDKVRVSFPPRQQMAGSDWELLNVKTTNGCWLACRVLSGKGDTSEFRRLWPLDEDSRIVAVTGKIDTHWDQEGRFTYNKDNRLWFARLDYFRKVLENRLLVPEDASGKPVPTQEPKAKTSEGSKVDGETGR